MTRDRVKHLLAKCDELHEEMGRLLAPTYRLQKHGVPSSPIEHIRDGRKGADEEFDRLDALWLKTWNQVVKFSGIS